MDSQEVTTGTFTCKLNCEDVEPRSVRIMEAELELVDEIKLCPHPGIDSLLNIQSADSVDLRARRQAAVYRMDTLNDFRLELMADDLSEMESDWEDTEMNLKALTTDLYIEEFLKRAILYDLEYRLDGAGSLTLSDWDEIFEIATLCSWEGGIARSVAQSLSRHLLDSTFTYKLDCQDIEPRSVRIMEEEIELADEITLYPNPGRVEIIVEFNSSQPDQFTIYNLKGQALLQMQAPSEANKVIINVSALPPGYYILQAIDIEGEILGNRKFILE